MCYVLKSSIRYLRQASTLSPVVVYVICFRGYSDAFDVAGIGNKIPFLFAFLCIKGLQEGTKSWLFPIFFSANLKDNIDVCASFVSAFSFCRSSSSCLPNSESSITARAPKSYVRLMYSFKGAEPPAHFGLPANCKRIRRVF